MEMKFRPPNEGLHANEEIEWMARKKTGFFLICGLVLGFFGLFGLMFDLVEGSVSTISILIGLYCTIIVSLFIKDRILSPTKYYITNRRVLETRGTRIVKQIELSRFGGRPIQDFIGKRVDYYENEVPVYDITVYDPVSSETLIKFENLSSSDTRKLDYLRYMIICKFCGTACSPRIEYCNECGNPLL
jgi:hypothetical protein